MLLFYFSLQEECGVPQMHMLSVAMEPILHKSCPPNCQDMLGWLPHPVALYVLSFLDCGKTLLHFLVTVDTMMHINTMICHILLSLFCLLVSLCHCSQVNRTWNNLAKSPSLWKNLCG